MNKEVFVVAAYIKYENTFLIAKRVKGDEGAEGKWEFPGGKIEDGETKFQAIKREIKEEFNMDVEPTNELITHTTNYPTRDITITLIECNAPSKKLLMNTKDHSEYKWITIQELDKYQFAKGDMAFLEYLKQS